MEPFYGDAREPEEAEQMQDEQSAPYAEQPEQPEKEPQALTEQPTEEQGEEPTEQPAQQPAERPVLVSDVGSRQESEPSEEPEPAHAKDPAIDDTIKRNAVDEELEKILRKQRATIKVIGTGGAGNNTINRIADVGITGTETIAVNTDAQDLLYTNAERKVLIGKELTGGLGAGSVPKIGEEAAKESEHELRKAVEHSDMVFITCGLGGGTGTGSAPIIADVAKKAGSLTVGIVTMPFTMEGKRRYENAVIGLERLEASVDTLIVIPNDKLLELAPDLPLHTAFKVADEILTNAVKGIAELVTKAGLVNLDFADIRAIMSNGGVALIGVGESDTDNRAMESVEKAVNNPLLDVDIAGANGALINIAGGPDMTLSEARSVVEAISEKLDESARIIWGAQISDDLSNTIRTMLIVTGVQSTQIFGQRQAASREKGEISSTLGIEFIS